MTKQGWEKKLKRKYPTGLYTMIIPPQFDDLEWQNQSVYNSLVDFISQELSTFAEEVEKEIIEKDPKKRKGCLWDEGVAQYTTAYNKRMRQALTNLKTKRGIK